MIWIVLLIAVVIWANWPEDTQRRPHFKRYLDGEVRFVEYRQRPRKK